MTKNELMNAIKNIRNGSFFKMSYSTNVPVKACYKKVGIEVVKNVSCIARTGVKYNNIASVIAKKSDPNYVAPAPRANNKEWIINNKIYKNTNTNTDYFRIGCPSATKSKVNYTAYDVNGNKIPFDKDFIIDSYWANKNEKPPVFDVKIDNVIEIG